MDATESALKAEIERLREELEIHEMTETCSQCGGHWHPSWVESGWCMMCILKEVKEQRNTAEKMSARLAEQLELRCRGESNTTDVLKALDDFKASVRK